METYASPGSSLSHLPLTSRTATIKWSSPPSLVPQVLSLCVCVCVKREGGGKDTKNCILSFTGNRYGNCYSTFKHVYTQSMGRVDAMLSVCDKQPFSIIM